MTMPSDTSQEFQISRTFNATRELLFKLFTDPQHLAHWWGPKGFTMGEMKQDLRPGGMFLYCMKSPMEEMWGRFIYREITPPDRIVFVSSFSDADGNITRHPMAPTFPAELLNVMTFTEADGKTTITLRGGPINASDEERSVYVAAFPSMQQGFTGTFDQLEAYLESLAQ